MMRELPVAGRHVLAVPRRGAIARGAQRADEDITAATRRGTKTCRFERR